MKYLLFISLFLLVACSSPSGRAPVYDVKLNKGSFNKSASYVASGQTIKSGQQKYIVQNGDTLYSIAWRADQDVNTLIKNNRLKKPYIIKKGQILELARSQKRQKVIVVNCVGQNCNKIGRENTKKDVVKKTSKVYPAKKAVEKTTKKQQASPQENTKKVSDWQWPSEGRLTKTFASSKQGMKGISISNSRNTPVYAAAAGKVVYAGSGLRGYGNLIIIKHNYDYLSAYAHNDKLIIKENDQVKVGQKIAVMGDSGADSIRLHFDIRYRGKSVDPLRYLPKR